MADNKKIYTIQINGIQQSIDGVESLKKSLDSLDSRIKELQSAKVEVNTTVQEPKQTRTSNTAALSEEDKLLKQIAQTEEKISAARSENYQQLLAQKDLLKEATNDAKQMAAQERLMADTYSNTMEGLKQKLADIKNVMQTTDLGGEEFKNLTSEANNLNTKLKELEKEYGVYSRDVGNYANGVAEGMKNLTIQVGDSTKEFDNAKQALKELKKERDTLAVKKDMGLISEEEAKRLEELIPTVAQLQSAIQDAGKPMDALMDSMQSVVALAQTGKGFAAFFGIDDDEIERSIQKLVALQNAMQGLQTIQKQLQSQEGIGQWLVKGNESIDKLVNSIFGVEKASKAATVASKALGTALKAIGIGAIIAGVTTLINLLERWSDKQKKAAEEAEEAAEKVRKAVDDQRQAYISASVQYENTASRLSHLRSEYLTTNDALRKTSILKEASKEFKNLGMSVKSVTDAQNILVNQGDKVIELIRLQGDAAALAALRMEAFKKSFSKILENNGDVNYARILASNGGLVKALDEQLDEVNQKIGKFQKELGIKTKETSSKQGKTVQDAEKKLTDLELRLMNEGLNKKLRQLDEEERQTINKLKENGRKSAAEIKKIQKAYVELRKREIESYLKDLEKSINDSSKKINDTKINLDIEGIDNQINGLKEELDKLQNMAPKDNRLISNFDLGDIFYNVNVSKEDLKKAYDYIEKLKDKANDIDPLEKLDFEENYKDALRIVRTYGAQILDITKEDIKSGDTMLLKSFMERDRNLRFYGAKTLDAIKKNIEEQEKLKEHRINLQYEQDQGAEVKRWEDQAKDLFKTRNDLDEQIKALNNSQREEDKEQLDRLKTDREEADKQIYKAEAEHVQKMINLTIAKNNAIKKNETDTLNQLKSAQSRYYDNVISSYRDRLSSINEGLGRNPQTNSFGIINIQKTKQDLNSLKKATDEAIRNITRDRAALNVLFYNGFIDENAFNETDKQLNDLENSFRKAQQQIEVDSSELVGKFIASLNTYVQQFGQSLNQVLQSVWQYQDAEYEANIEQLDKFIEKWNDKMNEQEQIAEEHKNAMEAIEGELATARGDRRQQLIDGLNAEILAQRNALREKKKAEKEAQKLEKKKEEEALEQRKREHDRAVTQAIISANLAVANALATQPFWPVGVAMGVLATALGAVQVALIKSQHYANGGVLGDGGVIQGKSHAQGGVKVLGGRAEVEGGEFITNKATTSKNVDLLEFINSKRKRINIDDLIEFYGGNSPIKKNIQTVRTKFADGGVVPTLRNDIELNDRLVTAMEDYSNRPVQVAVVDIMDRTQQVNEVKVMAGLSE